jgi:hypothetical protein
LCAVWLIAHPEPAQAESIADPDVYRLAQDYMLREINLTRSREGSPRVSFDALAAQSAKAHAEDMLAKAYFSHWGMDGRKPTRRFNLLGGYDAVAENIYYKKGELGSVEEMVEDAIQTLMDSPGHRETLLNPNSTHVGIGLAISEKGNEVYIAQEFVTKLGGAYYCPLYCRVGEQAAMAGRFDTSVFEMESVVLAYEELPKARDRRWLAKSKEYRDGERLLAGFTTADSRLSFKDIPTIRELELDDRSGYFKLSPKLDYKNQPGTYYFLVWLRGKQSGKPVLAAVATVEVQK